MLVNIRTGRLWLVISKKSAFTQTKLRVPQLSYRKHGHRCHGESGIPNFLYPRTIFTSEYRIGIQSTLVNIVRGPTFIPGYKVSPDVQPKGIWYPASAAIRRKGYPANRRKTPVRSLAIMLGAIKSAHCRVCSFYVAEKMATEEQDEKGETETETENVCCSA